MPEVSPSPAPGSGGAWRWVGPLLVACVFAAVVAVLRHELARLDFARVLAHLRAIPRRQVLIALGCTAASYWLLSTYEVLALAWVRRPIRYRWVLFTSFVAYSFGHTLGFAAFTGAAVRYRLYARAGITAVEVATLSIFCSLSLGIGLASVAGVSLLAAPGHAAQLLHVPENFSQLAGMLLLAAVVAYATWGSLAHNRLGVRGWALRAPGAPITLAQTALGVLDVCLAAAVLWALLPRAAQVGYVTFLAVYAAAVVAGVVSHVPGALGVFEAVVLLALPGVPADALLGSLLAWRAVYYVVPLILATLLFGGRELALHGRAARDARRGARGPPGAS